MDEAEDMQHDKFKWIAIASEAVMVTECDFERGFLIFSTLIKVQFVIRQNSTVKITFFKTTY